MIGLRKVVELRIYDNLKNNMVINKEKSNNLTYKYRWKNIYFLCNRKVYESRKYNNTDKRPLFLKKYDDNYLDFLLDKATEFDGDLSNEIDSEKGYILYINNLTGSSITYFGNNCESLKSKILTKKK